MIAAVPLHDAAAIIRLLWRTSRRVRAQTMRREKMAPAYPYDICLLRGSKRAVRQAHGEYLVRPDAGVVAVRSVDHVVQTFAVGAHEACKASFRGFRRGTEAVGLSQNSRERTYDAQGVVPQRIDFDRLADARGHNPITNLGIHPGDLHAGHSGLEQAVGAIDGDTVACSLLVPFDHVR